jgi:hypothetical protein
MTGSSFDGEAIAAMRKANQLLKEANVTWKDIIKPAPTARQIHQSTYQGNPVRPDYEHFASPRSWDDRRAASDKVKVDRQEQITAMFDKIFKHPSFTLSKPEYREMIHSIHRQWSGSGKMTDKQRSVIENAFLRAKAL